MRVLIVDDEPLARSALEQALCGRSDIEALESAKDAIQALNMMQKGKYDVLLLDIQMPELIVSPWSGRRRSLLQSTAPAQSRSLEAKSR